ncbi:MAG: glycosyltransferase family 4 protein [Capsulimonadales bacterium]|nr:glycosyltransferase family 4 protein [Capsulimonadales bacterium]
MTETIRAGFIMEQVLGHKTHAMNLKEFLASTTGIDPVYAFVPLPESFWKRVPYFRGDVMMQVGLDGRSELSRLTRELDVAFVHTLAAALFSGSLMRQVPTIVSLDATPRQWFELNQPFFKVPENPGVAQRVKMALMEKSQLKRRLLHRALQNAVHIVSWSEWAKSAVCEEYGIRPEKVTVIPPGVSTQRFAPGNRADNPDAGPVRLLFVGGDFVRKGGETLLRWARETRTSVPWELHIVTRENVPDPPAGVIIHNNIQNNSDFLVDLFRSSDLFVLPTFADCLPLVTLEAMASGLPIVASRVAAIPEVVQEGKTGYLFDPRDFDGFRAALDTCLEQPETRRQMSRLAREIALRRFGIEVTYQAVTEVVRRFAGEGRRPA